MPLHRFVDPAYYLGVGGAFPGSVFGTTYDRINVTSGGTGGGGSANADAAKAAGPNAGTYFMAFGEDATSRFLNRAHRALAQNTDFLDDVVHRDMVRIVAATALSAADAWIDLNGTADPIFVGNGGALAGDIFIVVDAATHEPIYDPITGTRVVASSIVPGVLGTGFSVSNPLRVNFNVPVPTGVSYAVYHGRRQNLATHDNDLVSKLGLPSIPVFSGFMRDVLRGGLDARYRNAQTAAPAALDTPGAGAIITRDGPAPAVDVATTANIFYDPIGACWKAFSSASGGAGGFISGESSGLGYVHYVSDRAADDLKEAGPANSVGSFASVWPHQHTGTFGGAVRTQVVPTRAAKLNPGAVGADVVELNVADYFYEGTNLTAVNVGIDMLEVTRASGDIEVYVITSLDVGSARRCVVRDLTGAPPTFPADEVVTCRWMSVKFWQGPGTGTKYETINGPSTDVVYLGGLQYFQMPPNGHAVPLSDVPVLISAASSSAVALQWTSFQPDATTGYAGAVAGLGSTGSHGALLGDGGIRTGGYSTLGNYRLKSSVLTVAATGSQQWDLVRYPRLTINVTADAKTLTLTLPGGLVVSEGMQVEVVVILGGGVTTFTLLWPVAPTNFYFSSTGDKTPTQNPSSKTVYRGTYDGTAGFLMTKTSFPAGGVAGP